MIVRLIDVLWVDWTRWVHEGVGASEAELRGQWACKVHECITVLWIRARRLCREYDLHADYVPGCVWSQPRVNHVSKFRAAWCGKLGAVVNDVWMTSATL